MSTLSEKKETMMRLIRRLNEATIAYDKGSPIISDKEWDDMYFDLIKLEKETGEILPNSPAHSISFDVVSELKKVEHNLDEYEEKLELCKKNQKLNDYLDNLEKHVDQEGLKIINEIREME